METITISAIEQCSQDIQDTVENIELTGFDIFLVKSFALPCKLSRPEASLLLIVPNYLEKDEKEKVSCQNFYCEHHDKYTSS